ncbi:MAG: amidohydrolase family protein [Alphaproteobacteria bacterium]|jgi:dihydroorotase|nr:amidohydrolase family protein [Alphaproteobacteria bacterium]
MSAPDPGKIAYVNARLVDPASGTDAPGGVLTIGETIARAGAGLFAKPGTVPSDATVVDCGGQVLAPGLVDMRVRIGEPGEEQKETFASASAAAAAGGVTAMACLPDTDPPIDSEPMLEFVARRAREVKQVKVYAYGCLTRGAEGADLAEIGLLKAAGAVAFTDGRRAIGNARVMQRALAYASAHGALVVQHPEEPDLAAGGQMNAGEIATRLGLAGLSKVAEVIQVERDLRLVAATGARYHVAHATTPEALDAIRAAKRAGLSVTCDVAPPYFALTEVDVGDYRTFAKLSPPLRDDLDRRALVDAIADGTVDVIASDHWPQDQDSKRLPFAQAEPGVVGLETLLPLALELYHQERISLIDLLEKLTSRPADLLRLPVGRLSAGAPADLVLFDPDAPGRIDVEQFRSKSKNSPFDGRPVMGRVLRTVVDGRTVFTAAA